MSLPGWPIATDTFATGRVGELGPLEDLGWISSAQAWHCAGPLLTRDGLGLLMNALDGRISARRVPEELRGQFDELVRNELLDSDGRLTNDGRLTALTLRGTVARVQVEATTSGRAYAFEAVLGTDRTVTLATQSPVLGPASSAALLALDVVDLEWAGPAAASWVGLGPAWTLAPDSPIVLDEELVYARVADPTLPLAPGADPLLAELWSHPWMLWGVQASGVQDRALLLRVGTRGQWLVQGQDGRVTLEPLPSHAAWNLLLATVEASWQAGSRG